MSAQWQDEAMPIKPGMALINGSGSDRVFCGASPMTRDEFIGRVVALAARLPDASHAINLCERRDHFIIGFCAAVLRGQVTLLPPSRAAGIVDDVAKRHPGSYRLGDALSTLPCDILVDDVAPDDRRSAISPNIDLRIPEDRLAMIGFTSGSTGAPSANPKKWGALVHTNTANLHALADLFEGQAASIVATVPPQHMYGMEMSVLMPLLGPFSVHAGRPFFPHDIASALSETSGPRLLVTTPVHLRALVESDIELPALRAIVTATAPLSADLATRAESRFDCEVRELFGSTETCVIAQRRTSREATWHLFEDVRLHPQPEGTRVERPSLASPLLLADLVDLVDEGRGFLLRGRRADLLEIAGKRASLGDLTRRLLAVDGVRDAVMLQAEPDSAGVRRLLAIVVADDALTDAQLIAALRQGTDPVFLPRRIIRAHALPRNETGKLPRSALDALIASR